jgi:hypothetical protein
MAETASIVLAKQPFLYVACVVGKIFGKIASSTSVRATPKA